MSLPYCEKYGFTAEKIKQRLQWLELEVVDPATTQQLAQQLQDDIIQPHITEIIEHFYDWLMTLDEARSFLQDEELLVHLRQTQSRHLLSLGVDFAQPEYFESRLRVGQAHVWVGLSLSLYQCAYRRLAQLILERIDSQHPEARQLTEFLHKIIVLDMSLAIETYHLAQVQSLEESLDRSQHQQRRLRLAACTDSLTCLANHKTIVGELETTLQQTPAAKVVAVMADIDFFKKVNDTHGHPVGDKVLVEVSRRMRSGLRDVDSIGRYGGEEFLLLLHGSSLDVAKQVAERIRQHVSGQPINLQGLEVRVTLSLGVSEARLGDSAETVIARADQALYAAKAAGRDRVEVA